MTADNIRTYPVYKGLQLPLEFKGIRGRFLTVYAVLLAIDFLGVFLGKAFIGSLLALVFFVVVAIAGYVYVRIEQKKGLHKKHKEYGVYIVGRLFECRMGVRNQKSEVRS